jgi:hypothetical protein
MGGDNGVEVRRDRAAEQEGRRRELTSERKYREDNAKKIGRKDCSEARRKSTEHAEACEGFELDRVVSFGSGDPVVESEVALRQW